MGIDLVTIDSSGNLGFAFACKWLRDDAPRELFWESEYGAGKREMTLDDLKTYQQEFKTYIQNLHFQAANPDDEEDYDKWISFDGQKSIDWDIYNCIEGFIYFLQGCINKGYSAYWSI